MKQRISLSFTGDIMCQREQLAACRTSGGYEFGPLFEPAAEALAASDYLVGNLETPFAGAEAGYTRELYSFNTPDSFAAALAACGFDLVSTANNHCLDRKLSGLKRTLDILDRAGIAHVGTALKDAVARIRLQTAPTAPWNSANSGRPTPRFSMSPPFRSNSPCRKASPATASSGSTFSPAGAKSAATTTMCSSGPNR